MTDWETNLTEQSVSQKSNEPAHVLSFGIELVLLEAMIFFPLPTIPQCESSQFLGRFSCSVRLENTKTVLGFLPTLKHKLFFRLLF